jgi:glycine/D-amino acid oxidase-like deaminating enzyme
VRIAVIGGSAAGLSGALMLARAGHDVVVLDGDDLTTAADVGSAAARAFRAAAPQIVQPMSCRRSACRSCAHACPMWWPPCSAAEPRRRR